MSKPLVTVVWTSRTRGRAEPRPVSVVCCDLCGARVAEPYLAQHVARTHQLPLALGAIRGVA